MSILLINSTNFLNCTKLEPLCDLQAVVSFKAEMDKNLIFREFLMFKDFRYLGYTFKAKRITYLSSVLECIDVIALGLMHVS